MFLSIGYIGKLKGEMVEISVFFLIKLFMIDYNILVYCFSWCRGIIYYL